MSTAATAAAAMDAGSYNPEKDSVILGGLFQSIINDLRGSSPIWEDFTYKSVKLHTSLKTTVVAVGAFLEAFQKVADMATSSKGATREIGSALTRLCMRHRSIESHLKALTSSILDNLVAPLQDKLEDWKKSVAQIDKDHSRENKKAKQDIKKAASDTIRLQKKVRKGSTHGKSDMQQKLDSAMLDVNSKYHQLEETEKNSVRSALIEERSRFCLFITCLKPFVDQELKLLTEMTHINEIMENLCMQASDPAILPASSEQVIMDLKGVDTTSFSFTQAYQQSSPPSSPSSLGSRKSSMCSINSVNSSSSSSSHSPSHTIHKHHHHVYAQGTDSQERDECDSTPTTPSDNTPSASSTWNNWPNMPGNPRLDQSRPHTISSAYEKGHTRPALKPDIFEPPQETVEMRPKTLRSLSQSSNSSSRENRPSATISKLQPVLPPHCPKPKIKAVAPPMLPPGVQPIYANMSDLAQRGSQSNLLPDGGGEPTIPASAATSMGESSCDPSASSPLVVVQPVQRMTALEQAMKQMDLCTASLNLDHDQASDSSEHSTPRSSTDDLTQEPSAVASISGDGPAAAGEMENVAESSRIKIQQTTSLELAKAIRELEVSTAALTSAYDSDAYSAVNNHTAVTSSTSAACDTDSYTSKMSLQCSSGYGTMNSTPAGSEDTIASGGIPVTGGGIVRRSSMSTQKPPPPVRRTASVSGAPTYLQMSSEKQSPADGHDSSYSIGGGEGLIESPYAELQVIQQSIHDQNRSQVAASGAAVKMLQFQRQTGSGDQSHIGLGYAPHPDGSFLHTHDTGGGQYAPSQLQGPTTTTNPIQSLNTKFASLTSQYQEEYGRDEVDSSGSTRSLVQKSAPQVMQKPNKNAFPPPPSAMVAHADQPQHLPSAHIGPSGIPQASQHPQQRNKFHGPQTHQQLQHQLARQLHQQKQQQSLYSEPNSYHVLPAHPEEDFPLPPTQEELQEIERVYSRQQQQQQQQPPPPPGQTIRAPIQRSKQMKQVAQATVPQQLSLQQHQLQQQQQMQHYHQLQQHRQQQQHQLHQQQHHQLPQQHQLQQQHQQHHLQQHPQQHHLQQQLQHQQHHSQQQHRHQLQQPQDVQASLLLELKKRVSMDESSEA